MYCVFFFFNRVQHLICCRQVIRAYICVSLYMCFFMMQAYKSISNEPKDLHTFYFWKWDFQVSTYWMEMSQYYSTQYYMSPQTGPPTQVTRTWMFCLITYIKCVCLLKGAVSNRDEPLTLLDAECTFIFMFEAQQIQPDTTNRTASLKLVNVFAFDDFEKQPFNNHKMLFLVPKIDLWVFKRSWEVFLCLLDYSYSLKWEDLYIIIALYLF